MARLTPREAALRIVKRLRGHGHEALWAGGCVRDMLLGREPEDYDVATNARPERVIELFRTTRKVGAQFGVVLVRMGRYWTEVATFRSDLPSEDGRHPSGVVFGSAQEDAKRRDFTVNGMFYDPLTEQVVDYVRGRDDLQAGVIRAIGEPKARFEEDHLRVLRAVRFAAKLGFEIEPVTLAALREGVRAIRGVSAERIREELSMMLTDSHRAAAFDLLGQLGLLPHLWAGAAWPAERIAACRAMFAELDGPVSFELGLAVLLHDLGRSDCARVCRLLACSNLTRRRVCRLVERCILLCCNQPPCLGELKRLVAADGFDDLMRFYRVRLLAAGKDAQPHAQLLQRAAAIPPEAVHPDPLVTGEDLITMGLQPGPPFKRILDQVYMSQLNEEITTRNEGMEFVRNLVAEQR